MILPLLLAAMTAATVLPVGNAPQALEVEHFPSRQHAFVWRNWPLVPSDRLAEVLNTDPDRVLALGRSMGLSDPPVITQDQWRRSYITIIRRNWHLLPYEQLLELLDWTPEEMAFCLREDDFLFIKLGSLKPQCEPLTYSEPTLEEENRAREIAADLKEAFPQGAGVSEKPLFAFVEELSRMPEERRNEVAKKESLFSPRYCYSYFALYGDPLIEEELDPFPEGYLARLADSGVSGVWLQGVLFKLAPFPWDPSLSEGYEKRRENLAELVARAKKFGIGIYLYLNEPRSMPLAFFEEHPDLKGVVEGEYAALCTTVPGVRDFLRDSVRDICEAVPDLAGFFTITASENLTNCWSHGRGADCPHCAPRGPAVVVPEVNTLIQEGIDAASSTATLFAWDWGWGDDWAIEAIGNLPPKVAHMSVSEWSIPIQRAGTESIIGEYSISEVGPGPRAQRHWQAAQEQGHKTLAKIQANNTWELSSVPYIPALENVANHAANLRQQGLDGLMLSWTLGGYPSPNLEVVAELGSATEMTPEEAMERVAESRFGPTAAPAVVQAWRDFSRVFRRYPYHIGTMYNGPQQMGPANLLWATPTGYSSTMVGFPYDNLEQWRAVYPAEIFAREFGAMGRDMAVVLGNLRENIEGLEIDPSQRAALDSECRIVEVCSLHFLSVANQANFILTRDELQGPQEPSERAGKIQELAEILESETQLATRLHELQSIDPRFGFEATNQYYYVPIDLAEKVINCQYLLDRWLPTL